MGRIACAVEGGRRSRVGNKLFEARFHLDLTSRLNTTLSPGAGRSPGLVSQVGLHRGEAWPRTPHRYSLYRLGKRRMELPFPPISVINIKVSEGNET